MDAATSANLTTFQSHIIYRKEWALKWFSAIIVLLGLMVISMEYCKSRSITILFLVLLIAPFAFLKSMMNYFTRKATIQLDENGISFGITKLADDKATQNDRYEFVDIASYQIQFPNNRFACIILKLKSGDKKEFSFRRKALDDTQSNADVIIETIHKTFERHGIDFTPSFYASQKGLYTIIFLLILLCIAFGIAIYLNKNLPATIIGSILLIGQILSRRVSDMNFYKKWKSLQ